MKVLKISKIIMISSTLLPLPAPAQIVKYEPAVFFGGYKEKEVEPTIWRVSATSNAISGGEPFAKAMAQYRAAEILKEKGFQYMRVLERKGWDSGMVIGSQNSISFQSKGGPGYAMLVVRGASGLDDVTGCRTSEVELCETVEIEKIMEQNRPFIRFKKSK